MPDGPQTSGPGGPQRPGTPPPPGGPLRRLEESFEGLLALARLLVLIPVVILLLAALGIFVYAAIVFFASMPGLFQHPTPVGHKLSVFVVEIDLFLIGATLIISAFGFYELFISKIGDGDGRGRRGLPAWLEMRDLNDLKARVASMLVLVAAVTFVDQVLAHNPGLNLLYLGVAVALVTGALIAFLWLGSGSERGPGS